MADFDASAPQVKLVKRLSGAYCSLDLNNLDPILSKNYQCEVLPERADFPKQTKESHIKIWGAGVFLVEQIRSAYPAPRNVFKFRLTSTTPRRSIQK
jgi:hypothetical protein